MINRRDFLWATTSLGLTSLLSGCGQQEETQIRLLKGSIPVQLISKFKDQLSRETQVAFALDIQLFAFYKLLQNWQQTNISSSNLPGWLPFVPSPPPSPANLITLGNFWLPSAIEQKLIDPLPLDSLSGWKNLPLRWQQLVTENDKIWAAPYRWGSTVIAYRRDKFKQLDWTPKDWSDLWRPEIQRLISVIDQPREIIGLTLKKLGHSYNTQALGNISNLKEELIKLNQQIKYYSSDYYLQPFILGDVWLTVGWSNEILPLAKNNDDIEVIIPASGTALWTEMWVKPALKEQGEVNQLSLDWIDFCWQPLAANLISLFTKGTSPTVFKIPQTEINKDLHNDLFINIPSEVLKKSEFIQPLSNEVTNKYLNLWKEIRNFSAQ
ncbi:MAG: extracellular solute-binding protein [Microcystaceae cyanobacterium]